MTIFPENVRLRPIALPTEHGGWAFILEPLVLGLAITPSLTGLLVAIAALAGFLFRQPMRIIWSDYSAHRNTSRTHAALVFGGVYFVTACTFLAAAVAENSAIAMPLVAALPLGLAVLFYDLRKESRSIVPELVGPIALASTAAAIVLGGGEALVTALVVWGLLIARAIPSILYVRSRLRLEHGRETTPRLAIGSHVVALLAVGAVGVSGLAPIPATFVYLVLLARAVAGLSRFRRPWPAKAVGFAELGWGVFSVVFLAIFFRI